MFVMGNHILLNCIHNIHCKQAQQTMLFCLIKEHTLGQQSFFLIYFIFFVKLDVVFFCCSFSFLCPWFFLIKDGSTETRDNKGYITTCTKTLVLLLVFPTNISAAIFPQSSSFLAHPLKSFPFTISRPPPQACKGIFLFPLAFGYFSSKKLNKPVCVCRCRCSSASGHLDGGFLRTSL